MPSNLITHEIKIVEEKNPRKIALNISEDFPIADGLSATTLSYLKNILGEKFASRFVSSENIVMAYRRKNAMKTNIICMGSSLLCF